jgi:hypothetical protein
MRNAYPFFDLAERDKKWIRVRSVISACGLPRNSRLSNISNKMNGSFLFELAKNLILPRLIMLRPVACLQKGQQDFLFNAHREQISALRRFAPGVR